MLPLLLMLQVKHFICDWTPFQTQYEIENKGTYWHWGGISHSLKHTVGTAVAILPFSPSLSIPLALLDGIVHYHVDWAKQNLVLNSGSTPDTQMFWVYMGLDQMLHQVTYLALAALAFH